MPHKARPLRTFWIYSDTSGVLLRWWTLAQTQTHQLVASTAMICVHHNRVTTSAEEEGSNNHSESTRGQGVTVEIIAKVRESRDKTVLTQRSHKSFFSVFFMLQSWNEVNRSYCTSDWMLCQRAVSVCPWLHISFQWSCPASGEPQPIKTRPRAALLV